MRGGSQDADGEDRYALAGDAVAAGVALERARSEAGSLEWLLRRVLCGCPLIVRAQMCGCFPVVRAEFCAKCAGTLATRLASVGSGAWKDAGPCGMEFKEWLAVLADLEPIWFEARPGVRYEVGYRRARLKAAELVKVLGRVPGWWVVDPDCWPDGMGIVRLTVPPEDARRLTEALSGEGADW